MQVGNEQRQCRIAFVGAGGMIVEHAKAFSGLPGVEFVAIHNRTRSKAESLAKQFDIADVFDDLGTMLDEAKPDLVVLAVYEPAILPLARLILEQPVALFMEKPIGLDLAEARNLHSLAKKNNRKVWVGLNRRTIGATTVALRDLADNDGPRFIHVQDQQNQEIARQAGNVETVVANYMYANSIHLVDYLNIFGRGAIDSVTVLQPWDADKPGVVVAHVAFSSGDTGIYEAIWNGPGPWACTISAPHRRWELRPLEKATFQNVGERTRQEVSGSELDVTYKPGFRVQAQRVIDAWRSQGTEACTVDDALASTELVAKIYGLGA